MENGSERRSFPRFERDDIYLVLFDPMEQQMLDGEPLLRDIGRGGAGIVTRAPVLPGEAVRFVLQLPRGKTASGLAKVRWACDGDPSSARRCGLEFVDWSPDGESRLEAALAPALPSMEEAGRYIDSALTCACALVTVLLFRAMAANGLLPWLSSQLAGSAGPLLLVAGIALGLVICFKK